MSTPMADLIGRLAISTNAATRSTADLLVPPAVTARAASRCLAVLLGPQLVEQKNAVSQALRLPQDFKRLVP
jgi:hypothetical protein